MNCDFCGHNGPDVYFRSAVVGEEWTEWYQCTDERACVDRQHEQNAARRERSRVAVGALAVA